MRGFKSRSDFYLNEAQRSATALTPYQRSDLFNLVSNPLRRSPKQTPIFSVLKIPATSALIKTGMPCG
jgi:hypothetical protein